MGGAKGLGGDGTHLATTASKNLAPMAASPLAFGRNPLDIALLSKPSLWSTMKRLDEPFPSGSISAPKSCTALQRVGMGIARSTLVATVRFACNFRTSAMMSASTRSLGKSHGSQTSLLPMCSVTHVGQHAYELNHSSIPLIRLPALELLRPSCSRGKRSPR